MNTFSRGRLFFVLWGLFLFALTNTIIHDFICHEELHQLANPVHHSFSCPENFDQEMISTIKPSAEKLSLLAECSLPFEFAPSIFHPPD
ncbi:MAG: hypothetical protein QME28_03975 [Candidatus Saccharicenans sp.]|nr:hypothetical protein [Candidatus Saccharicenans sp.]